jgi:hypothetical protein
MIKTIRPKLEFLSKEFVQKIQVLRKIMNSDAKACGISSLPEIKS